MTVGTSSSMRQTSGGRRMGCTACFTTLRPSEDDAEPGAVRCDSCQAAFHGSCWDRIGICVDCGADSASELSVAAPGGLKVLERAHPRRFRPRQTITARPKRGPSLGSKLANAGTGLPRRLGAVGDARVGTMLWGLVHRPISAALAVLAAISIGSFIWVSEVSAAEVGSAVVREPIETLSWLRFQLVAAIVPALVVGRRSEGRRVFALGTRWRRAVMASALAVVLLDLALMSWSLPLLRDEGLPFGLGWLLRYQVLPFTLVVIAVNLLDRLRGHRAPAAFSSAWLRTRSAAVLSWSGAALVAGTGYFIASRLLPTPIEGMRSLMPMDSVLPFASGLELTLADLTMAASLGLATAALYGPPASQDATFSLGRIVRVILILASLWLGLQVVLQHPPAGPILQAAAVALGVAVLLLPYQLALRVPPRVVEL